MRRGNRFWTILILPTGTHKSRRFVIPLYLPVLILLGLGLLAVAIGFTVEQNAQLRQELTSLRSMYAEINMREARLDEATKRLKKFQGLVDRLVEMDRRIRTMMSIDLDPGEGGEGKKALGGIGGPQEPEGPIPEDHSQLGPVDEVRTFLVDLDALENRAAYQEASFGEILDYFHERKAVLDSTPAIQPVEGWISSGFGTRNSPFTGRKQFHQGIDIVAFRGADVVSSADGVVREVVRDPGFGKLLTIDHGNGVLTRYGHNDKILVKEGQRVRRGDVVARVGRSGRSTGYHLHYEVWVNGEPVNPTSYILNEVLVANDLVDSLP